MYRLIIIQPLLVWLAIMLGQSCKHFELLFFPTYYFSEYTLLIDEKRVCFNRPFLTSKFI